MQNQKFTARSSPFFPEDFFLPDERAKDNPRLLSIERRVGGLNYFSNYENLLASFQALVYRYSNCSRFYVEASDEIKPSFDNELKTFGYYKLYKSDIDINTKFQDLLVNNANRGFSLQKKIEQKYVPAFFLLSNIAEEKSLKINDNCHLALLVIKSKENILFKLKYREHKFNKCCAVEILSHYEELTRSFCSNVNLNIATANMLTNSEKDFIFNTLNNTSVGYPHNMSITKVFEEQSQATPKNIALSFGKTKISYRDLNISANKFAAVLVNHGCKRNTIIALWACRSIERVIAILAILRIGSAYLPLEGTYPEKRLNNIFDEAKVACLILDRSNIIQNETYDFQVNKLLCLEDISTEIDHLDDEAYTFVQNAPQNTALIIFTSGSTGTPKGINITHRSIIRLVKNTNYIKFSTSTRLLHFAPISFDASLFEIWGALLNGGECIIFEKTHFLINKFIRSIKEYQINTVFITAALFNLIIDTKPNALKPLETIVVGGEALSLNHMSKAIKYFPNSILVNGYGPTESTTFALTHHIKTVINHYNVPIGRPINNTRAYVLDSNLQLLPKGIVGELFLAGDGLARGYLDKELTKQKFLRIHLTAFRKEILYKTGDLAFISSEGIFYCLGRKDEQIKISGFRIELGDIESALKNHSDVKNAGVLVKENKTGKELIAFVSYDNKKKNLTLSKKSIHTLLAQSLPYYMIPQKIFFLHFLPLSKNGKVDKHKLQSMLRSQDLILYSDTKNS